MNWRREKQREMNHSLIAFNSLLNEFLSREITAILYIQINVNISNCVDVQSEEGVVDYSVSKLAWIFVRRTTNSIAEKK